MERCNLRIFPSSARGSLTSRSTIRAGRVIWACRVHDVVQQHHTIDAEIDNETVFGVVQSGGGKDVHVGQELLRDRGVHGRCPGDGCIRDVNVFAV